MDHEFTCAWERMHGVRLSSLSPEAQQRVMFDRSRGKGTLDLRQAFDAYQPRRRAA